MIEVLVSRSAAALIFHETQRWVEAGLRRSGAALESLVYPLSALVPRAGLRTPLELTGVDDIAQIVIDGAAIPPDAVKVFSPANCRFAGDDLASVNAAFNEAIGAQLQRQPRLGVHSKLHCHPFPQGAFLSQGDLYFGVNGPAAVAWRERRGLSTAMLHVVHPDASPGLCDGPWSIVGDGAVGRAARGSPVRWHIHSWASDDAGGLHDLGVARVVSDRDHRVRAARRPPYWQTRAGARWCDAQKRALRAAGYRVSRNLLPRGWRRYLVAAKGRTLVIALPPDLPHVPPRVLEARRAWVDDFVPLDLPTALAPAPLNALSLEAIVEHCLASRPAPTDDAAAGQEPQRARRRSVATQETATVRGPR